MKFKTKSTLLALAGTGFLALPAMGAVTLQNDGLAIAFYSYTGIGASATVGPNTYIYNLGAANTFYNSTLTNAPVSTVNTGLTGSNPSNIGADLVSAFGTNWANSGEVRWMVVGTNSSLSNVNGDPSKTSYYSVARNDFSSTTSFFGTTAMLGSLLNTSSGQINSFVGGMQNQTAGTNANGAIVPKSVIKSVDEFVVPTTNSLWFAVGTNITQTLSSGTIPHQPTGTPVVEGALDIFRVISSTTDPLADLSVAYSPAAPVLRKGQQIGTLTLTGTGDLAWNPATISAVPEPSGAMALGLIGSLAGLGYRSRRK